MPPGRVGENLNPRILLGTLANSLVLFLLFSAHLFEGTAQIVFVCVTYILWG